MPKKAPSKRKSQLIELQSAAVALPGSKRVRKPPSASTTSSSIEHTSSLSLTSAPESEVKLSLAENKFIFFDADPELSPICAGWLELILKAKKENKMEEETRGGGRWLSVLHEQGDWKEGEELAEAWRDETIKIIRAKAIAAGIPIAHHKVSAMKVGNYPKGVKVQPPHFDGWSKSTADTTWGCVVYLTDCDSTAFNVKVPFEEMRSAFTDNVDVAMDDDELNRNIALCHPTNFAVFPVKATMMQLQRADVCHYGPDNPYDHDRNILFLYFTKRHKKNADLQQTYPCGPEYQPPADVPPYFHLPFSFAPRQ